MNYVEYMSKLISPESGGDGQRAKVPPLLKEVLEDAVCIVRRLLLPEGLVEEAPELAADLVKVPVVPVQLDEPFFWQIQCPAEVGVDGPDCCLLLPVDM